MPYKAIGVILLIVASMAVSGCGSASEAISEGPPAKVAEPAPPSRSGHDSGLRIVERFGPMREAENEINRRATEEINSLRRWWKDYCWRVDPASGSVVTAPRADQEKHLMWLPLAKFYPNEAHC